MSISSKPALERGLSEQTHLLRPDYPDLYGTTNTDVASASSRPSTPLLLPISSSDEFHAGTSARRFTSRATLWRKLLGSAVESKSQLRELSLGEPQASHIKHDVSDEFISVDWLEDANSPSPRGKNPRKAQGIIGSASSKVQGWVLLGLVGILVAGIAFLINAAEPVIYDLKFGYCSNSILASRRRCCDGQSFCNSWKTWGQWITDDQTTSPAYRTDEVLFNLLFYMVVMIMVALTSCALVIFDSRLFRIQDNTSFDGSPTTTKSTRDGHSENPQAIMYPSAGSGVAEVKVIASGFTIKHFLGVRTLFVKTVACILSVGSGLSVGKEGPIVHIAACVGNNVSRIFPDYNMNAGKRRAIISASSAAGFAVAFGTPFTGVLFSLEEISYRFSSKILFRTLFCVIVAILTLTYLSPYAHASFITLEAGNQPQWNGLEMGVFVLLGMLGGAIGAFMIKGIRFWSKNFRSMRFIKKWPLLETFVIAFLTGAISYWSYFSSAPLTELMSELASNCNEFGGPEDGLCPRREKIPRLIWSLLFAFAVRCFLTVVSYGLKVPAGIYMPPMAVGGLLGRAVGHTVQYLITKHGHDDIFNTCALDHHMEGCVIPGVYALVTAGATLCGVTRLSLSLPVMLFELTGSLQHVPIFSIAILVSKWTADFIEPENIYEAYLDRSDLPYLYKDPPKFSCRLGDITPSRFVGRTIDTTLSPKISSTKLREKLEFLTRSGQYDSGITILDCNVLIGLISYQDLAYCLDRIPEDEDVPCLVSPRMAQEQGIEEEAEKETDPTDFTPFIDPAPFSLDVRASLDFVYECFTSMDVRYICVSRDRRFVGLLRKKAFAKYAKQIRKSCKPSR